MCSSDLEPLSLIGETITLKYRSGVNSSTAGLTLTSTGTTFAGAVTTLSSSILAGTGGNARLGSVAGRVDLDPTNGRVALYGASAVDRYLDILRADGATIGVQLLSNGTSTFLGGATFGGAIAIGNTVNTVSPTSPNRTITMVIGGVTYYLHAKTTND